MGWRGSGAEAKRIYRFGYIDFFFFFLAPGRFARRANLVNPLKAQ